MTQPMTDVALQQLLKDESDVRKVITHISKNMTNTFDVTSNQGALVHLASGLHASEDVKTSLLGVADRGRQQMKDFISNRLTPDGKLNFHDRIPKSGIDTFTSMVKKTKLSASGKGPKAGLHAEMAFRRALTLSKIRENINMDSILSMPLTAVPTALFHEIGSIMRSTTKSDLLHRLEEETSAVKTLPGRNPSEVVYIRDAMAELHKLEGKKFQTFDKFAEHYTCELTKAFSFADKVIDVFDHYREDSVKNQARTK